MKNPATHLSYYLILLMAFLTSACQSQDEFKTIKALKWLDLTHAFDENTLYWPNDPHHFMHDTTHFGPSDKGYFYASFGFSAPEHGGTHIDAPIHFAQGKKSVDVLDFPQMINQGVCISVAKKALKDRNYQVQIQDVLDFERQYGNIPKGSFVLFHTGYGAFYPQRKAYFGTDLRGREALVALSFPGIAPETAQWLLRHRSVNGLGLDTPSLDDGRSQDFKTHRILMGADVPGFENLYQLEKLPPGPFLVLALPMKIKGGSGGPLRILAGLN